MSARQLYYGQSFQALREAGFAWLDERAADTPESARFIETNDYQHEAIADAWRADHDALRLTVSGLAEFGQTLHERLFGPYPELETLTRRRLIEQALLALPPGDDLEYARQHTPSMSELIRDLEAAGIQDTPTLRVRLEDTDLPTDTQELLIDAYEQYQTLQPTLAHPEVRPRSAQLQAVVDTDQSLQAACPALDAVVISGILDPAPIELALIDRLAEAVPVCVLVPTPTPTDPTAGIGTPLEDPIATLTEQGFEPEPLESVSESESELESKSKSESGSPLTDAAAALYQPPDPPPTPPAGLSWHEAPTPDREVRHLARRLRSRLATEENCEADDILVIAPGLLSYRDAITDTFEAYGIDHAYQVSILLERTYAGQAVLDALDLCTRPRGDRLARLLTNPLVEVPEIDPAAVADVQRRLYTTAIDPLVAELDESAAGVRALLGQAETIREASATDLIPAIEDLLETLGLEETIDDLEVEDSASETNHTANTRIDAGYEGRALGRVEAVLESVRTVCTELDPEEPLIEATTALEGVRVPPPPQVTTDRVEIIGLEDAPMADFEELYILGATAQHLSGRETRPRYFQTIGESLDLFEPHAQRDCDRYRFGMVLANAQRVHLTTPERTIDDEPLRVSPFLDELARVTGLEPTTGTADERRGSREDLQRGMAGADPDTLEAPLETAREKGHVDTDFVDVAMRGARCGAHRAASDLTAHDGQLPAAARDALDPKLTATPMSHSRLTQYAKCGFKYLLTKGWEFEEPEDIEPGISPLTVGSIVHETVESFYRTLQPGPDERVDLTGYDRGELERKLLAAGEAVVAASDVAVDGDSDGDSDSDGSDAFARRTLQGLFAGLATPAENDYWTPEATPGPAQGAFVQFLETERDRAAEGHRPMTVEAEFGAEAGVQLPSGERLPITGIIDRIDIGPDDGVTVFDYKASSVRGVRTRETQARDGIDFQLPLYMLGTPTLVDDPSLRPSAVDAGYYVLNADPTVTVRPSLTAQFDDLDMAAFLSYVVPDRVERATDGIETGAFQPAVVGADAANCEYCGFSDVCDVRHHRRYDVIEAIDEADHSAYIPDGVRPGDVRTHFPGGEDDD